MTAMVKPIETIYRGYRFRSRLEARWAVFYDTLGVPWEYEKEGYDLGGGVWYLPDFWMPQQECWIEIKGKKPEKEECQKAFELANQTKYPVFIFFGKIVLPEEIISIAEDIDGAYKYDFWGDHEVQWWDNCQWWCECRECGNFGISYCGRADRVIHRAGCSRDDNRKFDKGYNAESPAIMKAYLLARQRRFER